MKEDVEVAFKHYNMCYELMGNDGSRSVERRRECFLHLVALGIQCGMFSSDKCIHNLSCSNEYQFMYLIFIAKCLVDFLETQVS